MAVDEGSSEGLGTRANSDAASSISTPIDSSNIGFKLLKKHGWKEGTGLGYYEQGRLEPVQAFVKKNKRGLGADKPKKVIKPSKVRDGEDQKIFSQGIAMAVDEGSSEGLGTRANSDAASSISTPIDSSNIGFKLLKKHGWKEGTGLGYYEQGRLEPVQAFVKKNKRGLGADKPKKVIKPSKVRDGEDQKLTKGKTKGISKKMKKMLEFEKRMEEKEFDMAFFREFWPDNV